LEKQTVDINIPDQPLNLDPKTDLYTWLLFQGPTFQNIDKIYSLDDGQVLLSVTGSKNDTSQLCFSSAKLKPFILGSPLLRDVLLQSAQFTLTHNVYLPVSINKWEIHNLLTKKQYLECKLLEIDEEKALCAVKLCDRQGSVTETIDGYICKPLSETDEYPSPKQIADKELIQDRLIQSLKKLISLSINKIDLLVYKHSEAFHSLGTENRHRLVQNLFQQAYQSGEIDLLSTHSEIEWSSHGKPKLTNTDLNISISHSRTFLIMTIGKGLQGCDIEFVEDRAEADWLYLLGNKYSSTLNDLYKHDANFSVSGTRIWCAKEAILKGYGVFPEKLTVHSIQDQMIILSAEINNTKVAVATLPVMIWPLNTAILAIIIDIPQSKDMTSSIPNQVSVYDIRKNKFVHRFQSTFKDCKGFFGKTYFTNFPLWMGELRELILEPIKEQLNHDLGSGHYGMVTNLQQYGQFERLGKERLNREHKTRNRNNRSGCT